MPTSSLDLDMLRRKAETLLRLHHAPEILTLLNVADVGNARIVEETGFPAVATSSAGIAWLLGYADGERIRRREMFDMVGRIVAAVEVPVTADVEGGYGVTPGEVAQTVCQTLAAGAVGINLEDADRRSSKELLAEPLAAGQVLAAREAAEAAGVHLVINARTDGYLRRAHDAKTFADTVGRAQAYRQAGADCIFVPGVVDREIVAELAREIDGPINILANAAAPPLAELQALGVARLSVGSLVSLAAMTLFQRAGEELRGPGTYGFASDILSYAETNSLFDL